jgi:UDP-2,3-diacylglucosamine pyrophosphatase LpxH
VQFPDFEDFDELYAISDLHMGGRPGFQIFRQGPRLAELINYLNLRDPDLQIALCINGDTVDFLAEPNPRYFDAEDATGKLDSIFGDSSFLPVWNALRRFAATPKRRLIFTLGNHDLELALPWVQEHFLRFLSQNRDEARGRIRLSFDGAGYRCSVAGESILCIHGNEFDPWNLTDHERLRRIGRDRIQGRPVETWIPNAGTKLVIEVMNTIKAEFAFVDVLKPEIEGVLPILWVLGQATHSRIIAAAAVGQQLSWDVFRKRIGFLSAGESPAAQPAESDTLPEIAEYGSVSYSCEAELNRMLDWAEEQLDAGTEPLSLVEGGNDRLGMAGAIRNRLRGRPRHEQAWEALRELVSDSSFALDHDDSTYKRADQFVDQSLRFLITGHTHQARSMPRRHGSGHYFNTGTWAALMRLTPEQLRSADHFEPVLQRLSASKTLAALENQGLIECRPTVVSVVKTPDGAKATLSEFVVENDRPGFKELKA